MNLVLRKLDSKSFNDSCLFSDLFIFADMIIFSSDAVNALDVQQWMVKLLNSHIAFLSLKLSKHYLLPTMFTKGIQNDVLSKVAELSLNGDQANVKANTTKTALPLPNRKLVEDLLKRRFFIAQSFELYGGVSGLFDFGPLGCSTKNNLLTEWRNHFILKDNMLEIETSMLTPENVLKASGHVEKFCDFMTKDVVTGECFRVDHLIKECLSKSKIAKSEVDSLLAKIENMNIEEIKQLIRNHNIKSPNGNDLDDPHEFNLMFSTALGATGLHKCFLRPETAQGIFVNFPRLLVFNQGKLPFAAAQIGYAFRNEIAPRSGLLRVREFCMAEIEHFVDPQYKNHHPNFDKYANLELNLLSSKDQLQGLHNTRKLTIGQAVSDKIVDNKQLGYFMARIYLFLVKCGIADDKLRFRQHLPNEMAHYACDCWDAECLTTYGWVECVGCADRSCFDLSQHAKETGNNIVAERSLPAPKSVNKIKLKPNRKEIGMTYKTNAESIYSALYHLTDVEIQKIANIKDSGADSFDLKMDDGSLTTLPFNMVFITNEIYSVNYETFVPSVIEPSFGIGRILYSIWEHCFRIRESDAQRTYLSLPPSIAPYKCVVLPLSGDQRLMDVCGIVSDLLSENLISHKVERSTSVSIGKRYARTDEMGVPFCITVDFDSINISPQSVTLRERDMMTQLRVNIHDLASLVHDLCRSKITWEYAVSKYEAFVEQKTG
ncbi:hypothetical protein GJ496_009323 [Pomphorhynchus laevis]|nr:hypothetical protein GJ496_009323 [Pomphorhynchus laevis]